jgi:hypothetical protein
MGLDLLTKQYETEVRKWITPWKNEKKKSRLFTRPESPPSSPLPPSAIAIGRGPKNIKDGGRDREEGLNSSVHSLNYTFEINLII